MNKLVLILALMASSTVYAQTHQPRTFLLVHGAWSGGWDYAKVETVLRANGDKVYRPTLTGLGERVHLANPNINLTTFISDIVNVIKFEDLHNVILVGHSFGGMVISGVAEQLPERISHLVYLDAMVPNDGESAKMVCGDLWNSLMASHVKDGFMQYPFGPVRSTPPLDVAQSLKTFTEPLPIRNPLVKSIPTAFIVMTKNGQSQAANDRMGLVKARQRHWRIATLEGGHYAMREQPEQLVKKLEEVLN
ncbi:alpha/beta fold hydrolase [Spirosoma endbachense]|uniref:Alpha/beta fold hydrolase n=1 Tax=Spirosoma endbachense TaxID=2666025 RepID=A0A6P1W5F0_9BACT|nr:alpha/beta hydrolase [Spirosoma endbachense]QHW00246.1 alpha/beta fold hydrolase [Spirosoma endbachense]